MKIAINYEILKALLLIAGKQDIRYYLNGVCLQVNPDNVTLITTDGHKLLAVPLSWDDVENPINGEFIIPRDALEAVKPLKVGKENRLLIEVIQRAPTADPERDGVTIKYPPTFTLTGQTSANGNFIEAKFPDWKRVIPIAASREAAQFDADYVAAFGKVCKLLGSKHFTIHHNGSSGALIDGLGHGALGVIMPLRDDNTFPALPTWAKKPEFVKLQAVA